MAVENTAKEFPVRVDPITDYMNSDEIRVVLEDSFDISKINVSNELSIPIDAITSMRRKENGD